MLLEQKREAPRRLTHRTLRNALIICKLGGGTSESSIEYLDVRGVSGVVRGQVLTYCIAVNAYISNFEATMAGFSLYGAKLMQEDVEDSVRAVSIDMSAPVVMSTGGNKQEVLIKDALLANGVSQADIDAIPRITKEQFYTLE